MNPNLIERFSNIFLYCAGLIVFAASASAADIIVTSKNDGGAGSLRQAISTANTNGQADTITFDPGVFGTASTITLTSGELVIQPDSGNMLTIDGPGADLLTISGDKTSRVFFVNDFAKLTLGGVTVTQGNSFGNDDTYNELFERSFRHRKRRHNSAPPPSFVQSIIAKNSGR